MIEVYIKDINIWIQGLNDSVSLTAWANGESVLPVDYELPKPQYYPKAQLRRLSPFSKVALHTLDMPSALSDNLPLIFSSQHGDLAKTVQLIKDAALGDELSPTQFTLSVHNATTGLFGIATHNSAPTTTISAGHNTFVEGLIEASMQCTQEKTAVIYSYCDFDVPEEYSEFEQPKPARSISMVLNYQPSEGDKAGINIKTNTTNTTTTPTTTNKPSAEGDLSVEFIRQFYLNSSNKSVDNLSENSVMQSNHYSFTLALPL
jgi:hypothetical protein